jgi:predicted transposase/invertase (TIGR01784 family)
MVMENSSDTELFSPKEDIVFKMLFGDDQHTDILSAFLKAVLPPQEDDEWEEILLMPTIPPAEHPQDKVFILDVKVKSKLNSLAAVEIQLRSQPALRKRILYYATRLVTEQLGEGDDYGKIKPGITILITDFVLIRENTKYHNQYRLHDPETGSTFSDDLVLHILELPKLGEDDHTPLWAWMKFFSAKSKEELEMLATKDAGVKKAVNRLFELSADEAARSIREAQNKARRDHFAQLVYAREEGETAGEMRGFEKGIEKGRMEGLEEGIGKGRMEGLEEGNHEASLKIARELLARGIDPDIVLAVTGLERNELKQFLH